MRKLFFIALALAAFGRVSSADVVFIEDGESHGGGHGRTVCVEHDHGEVDCITGTRGPHHSDTTVVTQASELSDQGTWFYHNNPTDSQYGQIQIDCLHTSSQGVPWANY